MERMEITAKQLAEVIKSLPDPSKHEHGQRILVPLGTSIPITQCLDRIPTVGFVHEAEFICDRRENDWIIYSFTINGNLLLFR